MYIIISTIFQKILMKFFGFDSSLKSQDGWKFQKVFAIVYIGMMKL